MTDPVPIRPNTADPYAEHRSPTGQFTAGNRGKVKGTVHRRSKRAIDMAYDRLDRAFEVVDVALDQCDAKVALWILARFVPSERQVDLGDGTPEALRELMSEGELSLSELTKAAQAINALVSADEMKALMQRLDQLEAKLSIGGSAR